MLGLAVLTGGYSREELVAAGAYRVFQNAADLHAHLSELGLFPNDG
jgi:phosphoglycolate phosphatase-like HAD superfamily hydrolase